MQDCIEIMTVRAEEVEYRNWKTVFKISNDLVQLVVSTEVGPRILFYGFRGEENEFHEIPDHSGRGGDQIFRVYGGHRLWVSPEVARTYYPDNSPVSVKRHENSFIFAAPPESESPGTNLQKEIEIKLAETGSRVTVKHRIRNHSGKATKMAPWALSVMAGGGRPFSPFRCAHRSRPKDCCLEVSWPFGAIRTSRIRGGALARSISSFARQGIPRANSRSRCSGSSIHPGGALTSETAICS